MTSLFLFFFTLNYAFAGKKQPPCQNHLVKGAVYRTAITQGQQQWLGSGITLDLASFRDAEDNGLLAAFLQKLQNIFQKHPEFQGGRYFSIINALEFGPHTDVNVNGVVSIFVDASQRSIEKHLVKQAANGLWQFKKNLKAEITEICNEFKNATGIKLYVENQESSAGVSRFRQLAKNLTSATINNSHLKNQFVIKVIKIGNDNTNVDSNGELFIHSDISEAEFINHMLMNVLLNPDSDETHPFSRFQRLKGIQLEWTPSLGSSISYDYAVKLVEKLLEIFQDYKDPAGPDLKIITLSDVNENADLRGAVKIKHSFFDRFTINHLAKQRQRLHEISHVLGVFSSYQTSMLIDHGIALEAHPSILHSGDLDLGTFQKAIYSLERIFSQNQELRDKLRGHTIILHHSNLMNANNHWIHYQQSQPQIEKTLIFQLTALKRPPNPLSHEELTAFARHFRDGTPLPPRRR